MKIGIYGGSFSPPHKGHEKLAMHFLEEIKLDRLIIIPAGNPPHKKIDGGADGEMRLEMCRRAFLPLSDKIEVSDYEAYRKDPCYTVDTLKHFAPEGELYMLCGSDMFLTLDSWRDPEGIFSLATVVCGTRTDDPAIEANLHAKAMGYMKNYGARVEIMKFEPLEISSTEIRASVIAGKKPRGISHGVYDFIAENGLYGFGEGEPDEL